MKAPIPWVGGKGRLVETILSMFPLEYSQYVEVFGGGGALMHAKRPEAGEIYNDLNSDLVNMFRCIREKPLAVLRELNFLPLCSRDEFFLLIKFLEKEEFEEAVMREELDLAERLLEPTQFEEIIKIYQNRKEDYDIQRAAAFFRMMRYSFGAGGDSYACKGIDIRRFFYLIHQTSRRFRGVNIENQDFKTLIPHYDGKGVFFYLDPPYWNAEIYKIPFYKSDHVTLRDLLFKINGYFLLSYNDEPEIRELYKHFSIVPIERHDSLSMEKNKIYREVLISNYDMLARSRKMHTQLTLFSQEMIF